MAFVAFLNTAFKVCRSGLEAPENEHQVFRRGPKHAVMGVGVSKLGPGV